MENGDTDHLLIHFLNFQSLYQSATNDLFFLMEQKGNKYNIPPIEMNSCSPSPLPVPPTSQTMIMFEEIVSKSFQIIKTILPRVNSLYQLNQQLERSVSNIERKLTKLQFDNENLHYEMRTNHLAIEGKINTMANQYNNITNEACVLKKQTEILVKSVKEVKYMQSSERREQQDMEGPEKLRNCHEKTRKIFFEDQVKAADAFSKKKMLSRKNSFEMDDDLQECSKVHFNLHSNVSIDCSERNIPSISEKADFNSEYELSRKSNLKSKRNIINSQSSKSINKQNLKFQEFLREIEKYHHHNQMIKKNYEKLMDGYCTQNNQSFDEINNKINRLTAKLQELDPNNNLAQLLEKSAHLEFAQNLDQYKRALHCKVNADIFERSIKDLNGRLGKLHEMIRKFANRQQTQKAILCLENRLNSIVQGQNEDNEKKLAAINYIQLDKNGCLRPISDENQENCRKNLARYSHTVENTQRTLRNDQTKPKRLINSLHANVTNACSTDNRLNEERRSLNIQKSCNVEDETVRNYQRSMQKEKDMKLLKQKSIQMLDKSKVKIKPKLKKQRLIFEYD